MDRDFTESWLIEQGRRGNRQALQALVSRWNEPVLALAYRLLGHEADAEDARQQTLVRLVQGLDRFEGRSQFSTWVYRIAVNVCRDVRRRQSSRREMTAGDHDTTLFGKPSADKSTQTAQDDGWHVEKEERNDRLAAALARLDRDSLEIVVLRHYHDRTFAEISEVVNMPESTVRHRMAWALSSLRNELEPDDDGFRSTVASSGTTRASTEAVK